VPTRDRAPRSPRWWRAATGIGLVVVIVAMIVLTALVADGSGVEVCGRTTPCSDGGARATMVGVALLAIVAIVLACVAFVAVADRLERRLFPPRRGRSGDPRRR
jgi:Na+/melibiose symporter-like transporter